MVRLDIFALFIKMYFFFRKYAEQKADIFRLLGQSPWKQGQVYSFSGTWEVLFVFVGLFEKKDLWIVHYKFSVWNIYC